MDGGTECLWSRQHDATASRQIRDPPTDELVGSLHGVGQFLDLFWSDLPTLAAERLYERFRTEHLAREPLGLKLDARGREVGPVAVQGRRKRAAVQRRMPSPSCASRYRGCCEPGFQEKMAGAFATEHLVDIRQLTLQGTPFRTRRGVLLWQLRVSWSPAAARTQVSLHSRGQ